MPTSIQGIFRFIYTLLSLGIIMCLLTCSGHIAAETANSPCLSCHMIFVFLLVILEAAIAADVFLNSYWEEDFPDDPSGKFDEFKHFVRSNFDICEWVALSVVAAQALSIILAMVLRALGPENEIEYDSDDDAVPARLPLLRNKPQHGPSYGEPNSPRRIDSWHVRILDKANEQ
ncbi:unnamed protein product [Triticum turgidum subsp. durum]|uniref:Tetraspanin n=1 Tax=Triticum turgidum subsp. durum TaxID=4567 RepID=A0A9R1P9Y7_TRITD|nr:unnamed protein product [Triticum turgidum subsp. durum]